MRRTSYRASDGNRVVTRGVLYRQVSASGNIETKVMTQLLEKAFSEASRLPDEEQNTLAKRVLAEIESEQHWNELFLGSQDELAKLAKDTLAKHRAGETERLDSDKL